MKRNFSFAIYGYDYEVSGVGATGEEDDGCAVDYFCLTNSMTITV